MTPAWLFLSAALLAASCAQTEPVGATLAKLDGRPIQEVIARLGNPQSQDQRPEGTVYFWTEKTSVANAPITTTRVSYASGYRSTAETTAISDVPLPQSCTLRVVADGTGRIVKAETSTANSACASLSRKLAGAG